MNEQTTAETTEIKKEGRKTIRKKGRRQTKRN
jgi:hypothetical protein